MRFGKPIFISENAVQATLDTFVFSSSVKPDVGALQYLFLVEKILLDPKTPNGEKNRLYALQKVIVEIIIEQLGQLRLRFNRTLDPNEPYSLALQSIKADSFSQSIDLVGWSILYYLYVDIDLGLKSDDIAKVFGVTARTFRRYRSHGVRLLTQELWTSEIDCRRNHHYQYLRSKLEPLPLYKLIGRAAEIDQIVSLIKEDKQRIFFIQGERGVGKTAIIKQIIVALVHQIMIDDLLWFDGCSNIDTLALELRQHFAPQEKDVSMNSVFSFFNCIVVLDNADELIKLGDLDNILEIVEGAIIFVSSTSNYPSFANFEYVRLATLTEDETRLMIQQTPECFFPEDIYTHIWSVSQGNPSRIRQLINYHKFVSLSKDTKGDDISWLKSQQQLLLFFIPKNDGISVKDAVKLCHCLTLSDSDLDMLIHMQLFLLVDERIYNQVHPDTISSLKSKIDEAFFLIDLLDKLEEPWVIVSHFLMTYSPIIDYNLKLILVKKLWRKGLLFGNKFRWHAIIMEIAKHDDLWMQLARAISHKQLNNLDKAEAMLLHSSTLSGLNGNFKMQSVIVLEMVKVYRLQNKFKAAVYYLSILTDSLQSYLAPEFFDDLILEQAQLALNMNRIQHALAVSKSLHTAEARMIRAEAELRIGNIQACLDLCAEVLKQPGISERLRGVIHNMMGRCFEISNPERASNEFSLAIECFSRTFDFRNLCRSQINLGTALINLRQLDLAVESFNQAEELCSIAPDIISLQIIDKNRQYIHRLIALKN